MTIVDRYELGESVEWLEQKQQPATFLWLDGHTERVIVHTNAAARDGLAYVSWPESVREIDGQTCERPAGWVAADRIFRDQAALNAATTHGYACKTCGHPSPVGVGYVVTGTDAAKASAAVDRCACGASQRHGITYEPDAKYPHLVRAHCACGWRMSGYVRQGIAESVFVAQHLSTV